MRESLLTFSMATSGRTVWAGASPEGRPGRGSRRRIALQRMHDAVGRLAERPRDVVVTLLGQRLQVPVDKPDRYRVGIHLCPQLEQQKYLQPARPHSGRVERMDDGERPLPVSGVGAGHGGEPAQVLAQVAVRVEIPDEPFGEVEQAGAVLAHAELTREVLGE